MQPIARQNSMLFADAMQTKLIIYENPSAGLYHMEWSLMLEKKLGKYFPENPHATRSSCSIAFVASVAAAAAAAAAAVWAAAAVFVAAVTSNDDSTAFLARRSI